VVLTECFIDKDTVVIYSATNGLVRYATMGRKNLNSLKVVYPLRALRSLLVLAQLVEPYR
jgi:hypothetical protein